MKTSSSSPVHVNEEEHRIYVLVVGLVRDDPRTRSLIHYCNSRVYHFARLLSHQLNYNVDMFEYRVVVFAIAA